MSIREALPTDARYLAEVHVASWKAAYRGLLPDHVLENLSAEQKLKRWQARFSESGTKILVWEDGNRIAGFCFGGASRDGDKDPLCCSEIYAIYLMPEDWRKGIGRALCNAVLLHFQDLGFSEATLWVLRTNQRACAFYEQMGFALDGATKHKIKESGMVMDEARYRRILP